MRLSHRCQGFGVCLGDDRRRGFGVDLGDDRRRLGGLRHGWSGRSTGFHDGPAGHWRRFETQALPGIDEIIWPTDTVPMRQYPVIHPIAPGDVREGVTGPDRVIFSRPDCLGWRWRCAVVYRCGAAGGAGAQQALQESQA